MEEKQIREELEKTLAKDSSNYSKILELSKNSFKKVVFSCALLAR